jgi:hypothetical protein
MSKIRKGDLVEVIGNGRAQQNLGLAQGQKYDVLENLGDGEIKVRALHGLSGEQILRAVYFRVVPKKATKRPNVTKIETAFGTRTIGRQVGNLPRLWPC